MDAQQQEQAAFESSLAGSTEAGQDATAENNSVAVESPEPAVPTDAAQPQAAETAETESTAADPAKESPAADDDPVLLDGLKRSELRRLLANAADVETLKRQVDKAHGHIGELNRRFQQSPQPAATAAIAPSLSPDLQQFEADYPEVAQYVRALGVTPQQRQEAPPADAQQPAQAEVQPAQAGPDPLALELAVMDRMHTGWREKLGSQEFSMWMASQEDKVRQAFDTAQTADVMSSVLGQYEQWASARAAAADKSAKGQQRLQRSLTPSGNAPRPQSAPTELEAFEAALKS